MTETEDLEDQAKIQLWKEKLRELARVAAYKELSLPDKIKNYQQSKKISLIYKLILEKYPEDNQPLSC